MLGDVPRVRTAAAASGCCCCCSWGGSVKEGWTFRGVMPGIPVPGGAFSSGDRGDDSSISVVRGLSEGVAGGSCSSPSPASSPIAASLSLNLVSCSSAARSSMVASRFASGERSSRNEYTPRPGLIPSARGFRLVAEPASDASLDGVSMASCALRFEYPSKKLTRVDKISIDISSAWQSIEAPRPCGRLARPIGALGAPLGAPRGSRIPRGRSSAFPRSPETRDAFAGFAWGPHPGRRSPRQTPSSPRRTSPGPSRVARRWPPCAWASRIGCSTASPPRP